MALVVCQVDSTGLDQLIIKLQSMTAEVMTRMATDVQVQMGIDGDAAPSFPPAWLSPVTGVPQSWDSEIQKRAFFATNGFGKGIPYQRMGGYISGWTVTPIDNGAELANRCGYAAAVGGFPGGWQSAIHAERWQNTMDVLTQVISDYVEGQ